MDIFHIIRIRSSEFEKHASSRYFELYTLSNTVLLLSSSGIFFFAVKKSHNAGSAECFFRTSEDTALSRGKGMSIPFRYRLLIFRMTSSRQNRPWPRFGLATAWNFHLVHSVTPSLENTVNGHDNIWILILFKLKNYFF